MDRVEKHENAKHEGDVAVEELPARQITLAELIAAQDLVTPSSEH